MKMIIKNTQPIWLSFLLCFLAMPMAFGQDEGNVCRNGGKVYDSDGQFLSSDFVAGGSGLTFGTSIAPDFGGAIDLDNIVFPSDQAFFVDYIGEGAGASHLFGFFFLDIDTNKNGIPNFFEISDTDDMDGDGIRNSEDDDDDGDGILDVDDTMAKAGGDDITVTASMPAEAFRNGAAAAAAGEHADDFWQWVPSNTITYDGEKIFAHPGAYLYVDNNTDGVPDILEAPGNTNSMPAYVVDKDHDRNANRVRYGSDEFPALLGNWNVTVGGQNRVFWLGSTIFKLADDDGDTSAHWTYNDYSPYNVTDSSSQQNARPDYNIYGTTDVSSGLIPELVLGNDPLGTSFWRYRWYESDISGGRELVFFLTVFYGSGGRNVNTYYSKSNFNPDPGDTFYTSNGSTSGDQFGYNDPPLGTQTDNNWFPKLQSNWAHNKVAQYAWGDDWNVFATQPTDATYPQAKPGFEDRQDWINYWQNYNQDTEVINYIALKNWLDSAGGFEALVNARYGIDLETETDVSMIRKSNGNMNHMMVGAPESEKEAWLLGWEDLFNGGDRDYEDVVFYVKREARGSAQSLNVAGDLDRFEDVSITTVEFEFEDSFTEDKQGVEGNYINYFYRLSSVDEWIPLLGGEHLADPNIFTTTEENGGIVRRHVVLQLSDEGSRELYWKVEMNSDDVSVFQPEVHHASVDYKALVHEVFYNGGVIASSNVDYYGAYETPRISWEEKSHNRGHLYARKTFEHGDPPTLVTITNSANNPEADLEAAPPDPWLWDAGYSMLGQVSAIIPSRTIYTFTTTTSGDFHEKSQITEHLFEPVTMDDEVRLALNLSSDRQDGEIKDNFHDPAGDFNLDLASDWLAAWHHGYHGIVGGVAGYNREWILGGLNRASPAVVRPPGVPVWMTGDGIDANIKKTYWDYMDDYRTAPTRVLIGSESGMIHVINAGQWIGKKKSVDDVWMDGHYVDYGDGTEKWAIIPANLLDDLKNNYHGASTVSARIDNTAMIASIRVNKNWRRIAIISQGENGGEDEGRFGNYVWAMDITEIDEQPEVLWERTAENYHQIIGQVAMGWLEFDESGSTNEDEGVWAAVYTSGAGQAKDDGGDLLPGTIEIVEAYTGKLMKRVYLRPGEYMAGTPALSDINSDGFADWVIGGTSEGRMIAFSLVDFNTFVARDLGAAGRFFLSPNITNYNDKILSVVTATGDNPLLVDEDQGPEQNMVLSFHFDTENLQWDVKAAYQLPKGHKAFSRPLLMSGTLLMATTTGETFDYCDFDPDDPGGLFLFTNLEDFSENDIIENFGTVKAPITGGGRPHIHKSIVGKDQDWNDASTPAGIKNIPKYPEPAKWVKANIFMPLGYEEMIIGEDY